jgi:hypothetical protein
LKSLLRWLNQSMTNWLIRGRKTSHVPMCDFDRLKYEIRPADVILVEGHTRASEVIKTISQSSWTHAALYIGRLYDISDPTLRAKVQEAYKGDPNEQLLLEAELGLGTVVVPLSKYQHEHLRICRPKSLSPTDALKVVAYCVGCLGGEYDVRGVLDLARFVLPWSIMPRRWRSSLFEHNAGSQTKTICSTLLADAFTHVKYPILPFIDRSESGEIKLYKRNTRLFSPRDFDYSPYFDIIKYPYLGLDDISMYRDLPWCDSNVIYNDDAVTLKKNLNQYHQEKKSEQESLAIIHAPSSTSDGNFLKQYEIFLQTNTPILNTRGRGR